MAKVFVSYSRKDIEFAKRLTGELQKSELDFWVDWEGIPPTVDWWKQIEKGIEEADAFLFLISPDSAASKVCGQEIDCAVKNGKRLIPLIVRDIKGDEAPSQLGHLNWIFFRESDDFDAAIKKLMTAIHTDYEWAQSHRRLQVKALEWERNNHENSFLLRGKDLQDAELGLVTNSSKEPHPTELQRDYIDKSRQAADRQRRITIGISVVGIIALAGLAVYGFMQAGLATTSRNDAQAASTLAVANASNAQEASTFAVAQQSTAQANAGEALKQANLAQSQMLIANANSDPLAVQTNLLLSLEAFNLVKDYPPADRISAEQSIRDALSQISGIPLVGYSNFINTLAFSPDGNWLATGSEDTTVRLWDIRTPSAQPIVLKGFNGAIRGLAFSSDGKWLATRSYNDNGDNATARLWDMNNPSAAPIVLKGHEDYISTLAFSPDGNWLATGSYDNTARLWDMRNPSAEPIVLKHEDSIVTLTFSPDGNWLATSESRTTHLWDIHNPSAEPIVLKSGVSIHDVLAFSPDGNWLAIDDQLWDIRDPSAEPITLSRPEGIFFALAFSPDGKWLATGSDDKNARLWDVRDPTNAAIIDPIVLRGHQDIITTLAFSPDGKWLATGSDDGTARLWGVPDIYSNNPANPPESIVLKGGGGTTLAFSLDGKWLTTGYRLWNIPNPSTEPIVLKGDDEDATNPIDIYALAISPDGNRLATGSDVARLWDMRNPSAQPIVLKHDGFIDTLAFSPDGNWLATGSGTFTDTDPMLTIGIARLWDMRNLSAEPIVLKGHEDFIDTIAFSPDGNWLATGSDEDTTSYLWDMRNPSAQPIVLKGHEEPILTLAFSPDGNWLATGSGIYLPDSTLTIGTARLWDMRDPTATPIVLKGAEDKINILAFSPDGNWLATGSDTAHLWDMRNPSAQPIVLEHDGDIDILAFSPDGNWLATGSYATARLWDMLNPSAEPIVLKGHESSISSLAFSPDGNWLATGSDDNTARLWDLHNPSANSIVLKGYEGEITRLTSNPVNNLAFSPDGNWLVGSYQNTVRLWNLKIDYLFKKACSVVGYNFDRGTWEVYFPNQEYRKTCEQWPFLEPELFALPTPTP